MGLGRCHFTSAIADDLCREEWWERKQEQAGRQAGRQEQTQEQVQDRKQQGDREARGNAGRCKTATARQKCVQGSREAGSRVG
jgi:hypothetical protein